MLTRVGLALVLSASVGLTTLSPRPALATGCTPTGFQGLTAALVNPAGTVSGAVNATGCDIGVYYNTGRGTVNRANVFGALYYGVVVHGDNAAVSVDVIGSNVHDIGDTPLNGNQRGVAIYYRAFLNGSASGTIRDNTLSRYQKGGIVTNGRGTRVTVQDNVVTGLGPVSFIAQNGIQVGYGADASVMRNTVSGNSYTGNSTVSGGIIVVGGPGYGVCPDGQACSYTTGTQIVGNSVVNNDVGVFLTNIAADGSAPTTATNVRAINNTISDNAVSNGYVYQAGVSDVGNNDKIINNTISGVGYASCAPGYCVAVDADPAYTNRPKVHANN